PDAASWYVGWYEPSGRRRNRSFGRGAKGKKKAEDFRRRLEAELMTGTYNMQPRKTWEEFVEEYDRRILAGLAVRSRPEARTALEHFRRIVRPVRMLGINTASVDDFIATRRGEAGKKRGALVSPATLNKDLRHIRAALRKAAKWGYLSTVPD